jgi:CheY-like chemotaxis protein
MSHSPEPDRRHRVLVVDDEPTLRLGFSYALAEHETDTAGSGREALAMIEKTAYDVMILDLRMPEIDGLQVIEILRRQQVPLPVVLCSAALTPAAALRAITGNVVDFLLKPVRPAELRGVIAQVLHPDGDPLAEALREVRCGRLEAGMEQLGRIQQDDPRAASWWSILRAIRLGDLEGEAAAFAKMEREGLEQLAFRLAG